MARLCLARELRACIKTFPNFPKEGIQFEDVSGLLSNPKLCRLAVQECASWTRQITPAITKVAGLESRGFLLGPLIAAELKLPFIMVRKPKKLPGVVCRVDYTKEYGTDAFEVQTDAFLPTDNVLLVDDLLATGGSIVAAAKLIQSVGAHPVAFSTIVFLTYLPGLATLSAAFPDLVTHALLPLKVDGSIDEAHVPSDQLADASGTMAVLAFDIGSGTTKASLVLVDKEKVREQSMHDPNSACIQNVLMSDQVDILVGVDYQLNGHISVRTQQALLDTIQLFMSKAKSLIKGVPMYVTGVATAVFRDAQNADLLEHMQQTMHCKLKCVTPWDEATLGWTTAMLLKSSINPVGSESDLAKKCLESDTVWDLGGGSSQWTTREFLGRAGIALSPECVNMGTSHALKALEALRQQSGELRSTQDLVFNGAAGGPIIKVTFGEACQLADTLTDTFRRGMTDARHMEPDAVLGPWEDGSKYVMCIGGPTSAFAAVQTVLDPEAASATRSHVFTIQDVKTALARVTTSRGPSSVSISRDWHFMLVPKLCLVLAGMRAMG